MQHAEIYNGHARRFQQMARHIELSMTPQHQQKHGGPDPISTNDITLATTLLNSVYGYPAGKTKSPDMAENRNLGEGMSWDVAYTKNTFPEYMIEIRNTGTLFRDWEESTDLIYFMYLQTK